MTRGALLLALIVAGLTGAGCGSSHTSTPATPAVTTPPATALSTATTTTTTPSTTTAGSRPPSHSTGSGAAAASSPTAEQVARAKQALAVCQKENPAITLKELEREAASPHGIQC